MSETEFDEIFKNRGGLLKNVPELFKPLADFSLRICRDTIERIRSNNPTFPDVFVGIIDNKSINATVIVDKKDKYYIGIHFGTLIIAQDAFFRMLSLRSVFSDIGDVSKEVDIEKVHNLQVNDMDEFLLNRPDWEIIFPQEPKRILLAQILLATVIEFIFNHEYSHIIRGHVGYLKSSQSIFFLNEAPENDVKENNSSNILIRQTLEMDADGFAISIGLQNLYRVNKNLQYLEPNMREFFEDWRKMFRIWVFGVYSFYKIIGHKVRSTTTSFNNIHPPPSIRAALIQIQAATILDDKNVVNSDDLTKICVSAWAEADAAFSEASFLELDLFEMLFVNSPKAMRHMDALVGNWKVMRPLLQPFASMKLV